MPVGNQPTQAVKVIRDPHLRATDESAWIIYLDQNGFESKRRWSEMISIGLKAEVSQVLNSSGTIMNYFRLKVPVLARCYAGLRVILNKELPVMTVHFGQEPPKKILVTNLDICRTDPLPVNSVYIKRDKTDFKDLLSVNLYQNKSSLQMLGILFNSKRIRMTSLFPAYSFRLERIVIELEKHFPLLCDGDFIITRRAEISLN